MNRDNIKLVCVLKSSPTYNSQYVDMLRAGFQKNKPKDTPMVFRCMSDQKKYLMHLKYSWKSWWCKMELFRPDIKGDILYMDLDTIIYKNLKPIIDICKNISQPIMLAPLNSKSSIGSGVMWLPEICRQKIWDAWIEKPDFWMKKFRGDQNFIHHIYQKDLLEFQKLLPGCIVSYKWDCRHKVPDNAIIICYHGVPRPHHTNWSPYFIQDTQTKKWVPINFK